MLVNESKLEAFLAYFFYENVFLGFCSFVNLFFYRFFQLTYESGLFINFL